MLSQGREAQASENAAVYDLHLLGGKRLHSVDPLSAAALAKSHEIQPMEKPTE